MQFEALSKIIWYFVILLSLSCCEAFTINSPIHPTKGEFPNPSYEPLKFHANRIIAPLQMSIVPPESPDTAEEEDLELSMEDEARQETNDLILDFAHKVDETPVGELEQDDLEFIKPILLELETISQRGEGVDLGYGNDDDDGDDDGGQVLVAELVEKLVSRIVDEWQDAVINDIDIDFEPDAQLFNIALQAWVRAANKENQMTILERSNDLFQEMKDFYESGLESCKPDIVSFNAILGVIAVRRGRGGQEESALEMYEFMKEIGVMPDEETFRLLISIFTGSRSKTAASVADDLLRRGIAVFPPSGREGGIGIETFNSVLYAWAKSNDKESSKRIEQILGLMDECNMKPDVRSFTIYLDSFAQNFNWESVQEADNILCKLIDLHLSGQLDFEPDVTCWTTVLRGWMRLAKRKRDAAYRAEEIMEKMIVLQDDGKITTKADHIVYHSVLSAYAYAKLMGDAERILATMEYLWKQGDEEMKPPVIAFSALIDGWVNSSKEGAMVKAQTTFDRMLQLHEDCEEDLLTKIYKSLIFGYSKDRNPMKAEEILRAMIEKGLKVDSFAFDKIIDSYTHAGDEIQIKNVYNVFELMESCQKQGLMQANERVYTSLIRAIAKDAKKGMAKKSQTIIRRMEQLYNSGNEAVLPTVFTYNALLKACSKSVVLDDDEKNAAFNIAIGTFNHLRSSEELAPDYVTYSSLIKCSHLLPEGSKRDNLIIATSKQCLKDGMVNEVYIKILEEYTSEKLFAKLNKALS